MDLKLYDDVVVHIFIIKGKDVSYSITTNRGELVAYSNAEVVDLQEKEDHVLSMTVRTSGYDFEIRLGPNYTYQAYKKLRR